MTCMNKDKGVWIDALYARLSNRGSSDQRALHLIKCFFLLVICIGICEEASMLPSDEVDQGRVPRQENIC